MNTKRRYARNGALIIGIPFLLWTLFLVSSVYSTGDRSLGSVISFGVVFPAMLLGSPWALIALFTTAELQTQLAGSAISRPIVTIGMLVLALSPALNGALIGYGIGAIKDKKLKAAQEHNEGINESKGSE